MAEEMDDDFWGNVDFDSIEKAAVEITSAKRQRQYHRPPEGQQPQFYPYPPPAPPLPPRQNQDISFSPPREFSQRSTATTFYHQDPSISDMVVDNNSENDGEMDRLKQELGRVSKQLADLEQECSDLRKERHETEKQLKSVLSHAEGKHVKDHTLRYPYMENELHPHRFPKGYPHLNQNTSNVVVGCQTKETCAKGVQTEETGDYSQPVDNGDLSSRRDLPQKLLVIWGSPTCESLGKDLVSKLMVACSTDLQILFGFLNISLSSKIMRVPLQDEKFSKRAMQDNFKSVYSSEAAKVSHFHTMFTKVSSGMVQLQTFLEALLDLCNLPNADILYRSLRILHVFLGHVLGSERKFKRRNNVTIEGCSMDNTTDVYESMCPISLNGTHNEGHIVSELGAFNCDVFGRERAGVHGIELPLSFINWVSLFELMHELSVANTDEHVRFEAVSIMNVVLLKSSSYVEKKQFGPIIFRSVSKFLRKEAGSRVRREAVHLLHSLLNCPKQLVIFCSGCIKEAETAVATDNAKDLTMYEDFSRILEALGDCIADTGHNLQDLILRRNAIILLAFLASSGDIGLNIVLSHTLSKRTKFLVLILHVLVSEVDMAEAKSTLKVHQERLLLVREALIFLNRLISNPTSSSMALRIITSTRDAAGWAVDIADRLSHTGPRTWGVNSASRKIWESEIVDLGRAFRRRLYAFLGDSC